MDQCKFKSIDLRKIAKTSTYNKNLKQPELNYIIDIVKEDEDSKNLLPERIKIFEENVKEFMNIEKSNETFIARISIINFK